MSAYLWEQRTLTQPVEFRSEGKSLIASGYAAVFGKRSQNLGGFVEVVAPTAFNKTIKEADVVALRDHDPSKVLGRVSAGTLRLSVDDVGLGYEIDLPDTTDGRDLAVLLERRDIVGSSFGFRVTKDGDEWGYTEDGFPLRTLTDVALRDVSPVTYPAYPDSDAALRHLAEARSLDFDMVKAAAKANDLRSLLNEETDETVESDETRDDRETHIVLRHQRRYIHL